MVLWHLDTDPISKSGIFFQRYNATAQPLGNPVLIKQMVNFEDNNPSIAALDDGFIVVWQWEKKSIDPGTILGQRFNNSGAKVGSEFTINKTKTKYQQHPKVAALADGGFVVTWTALGTGDEIYAQAYDKKGKKDGGELAVNTTKIKNQSYPTVAGLPEGGFVIAWQSVGQTPQDPTHADIYGQLFDKTAKKKGAEFRINSVTTGDQLRPVAQRTATGFSVMWLSGLDQPSELVMRRFNNAGQALAPETTLGSPAFGTAAVASFASGRSVVVWNSSPTIAGRILTPGGQSETGQFPAAQTPSNNIHLGDPVVATLSGNKFVAIWERLVSGSDGGLRLQVLDIPPVQ